MPILWQLGVLVALLGGGWLYDEFVDDPHVRQLVTVELTSQFEQAAAEAKAAAELKLFRAVEAASNNYIEQMTEDRAWAAARDELTRAEIERYESELAAAGGGVCLLDQHDLDFLDGVRGQPGATGGR